MIINKELENKLEQKIKSSAEFSEFISNLVNYLENNPDLSDLKFDKYGNIDMEIEGNKKYAETETEEFTDDYIFHLSDYDTELTSYVISNYFIKFLEESWDINLNKDNMSSTDILKELENIKLENQKQIDSFENKNFKKNIKINLWKKENNTKEEPNEEMIKYILQNSDIDKKFNLKKEIIKSHLNEINNNINNFKKLFNLNKTIKKNNITKM